VVDDQLTSAKNLEAYVSIEDTHFNTACNVACQKFQLLYNTIYNTTTGCFQSHLHL